MLSIQTSSPSPQTVGSNHNGASHVIQAALFTVAIMIFCAGSIMGIIQLFNVCLANPDRHKPQSIRGTQALLGHNRPCTQPFNYNKMSQLQPTIEEKHQRPT